jgi:23S rRNA pseudouridine1911/1915/1917 synthase
MSHYRAKVPGSLLEALERMFAGRSRRDLRRLLHDQRVELNGQVATNPRAEVKAGDVIECTRFGRSRTLHAKVRLLYEDDDVLVVDKDTDILTEGGVAGRRATVVRVLNEYLRKGGTARTVHPCHRLDRGVSGLLVFAKSRELAGVVRSNPRHYLKERIYHAMVEGTPDPEEGTIESYLRDCEDQVVRVTGPDQGGKLSICHYREVEAAGRYAIVEIRLETGRKNQIRVQMSEIGHPIAGDRKYGARSDPLHRIALHARRLVLIQPATGERLEFDSPPPFRLRRRSRSEG